MDFCKRCPINQLIWINENLILNKYQIAKVLRNGNYTDVFTIDGNFYSTWDEDKKYWDQWIQKGGEG